MPPVVPPPVVPPLLPPRRPRDVELRDREVVRFAVLRGFAAVVRDAFVARLAGARFAVDLRAGDVRVAPVLADFARVVRFAVERLAADFRAVDLRALVLRFAVDLRAGADAELEPDEAEAEPSIVHLPDITRCAASATASAMIEPSLVALETTLLAAWDAVSAASSPASRIFLRAAGLAAIAAAAAVSPAASISLLIAAFASLSIVALLDRELDDDELERELEELEREELLRGDFAIFYLPPSEERHFTAVPVPK